MDLDSIHRTILVLCLPLYRAHKIQSFLESADTRPSKRDLTRGICTEKIFGKTIPLSTRWECFRQLHLSLERDGRRIPDVDDRAVIASRIRE